MFVHTGVLCLFIQGCCVCSYRGAVFVHTGVLCLFIQEGPSPADHQTLADPCKRTLSPAFTLPFSAATPRFQQWSNNLEHLGQVTSDCAREGIQLE